jgi:hypothetical protein
MLSGSLNLPAGEPTEKELPELLDAVTLSVQNGQELAAKFEGSQSLEVFSALAAKAALLTDPGKPEEFPFGFTLLPTKIEHSPTPGIVAVDLNPVDMRHASDSPVYPTTVARLFIDTTPERDGIEYLISY